MDARSFVDILYWQCKHLQTLVEHIHTDITTVEHHLLTGSAAALVSTPQLKELTEQTQILAHEVKRFQEFVRTLEAMSTPANVR